MGDRMTKPALDVGIVANDAVPLISFYRDAFGFKEQEALEIPGSGTIHKLSWGESLLRIFVPTAPARPVAVEEGFAARCGYRYAFLEVSDVKSTAAAAKEVGGTILLEPFELRPGRWVCQIADPDGNVVEIGQG